MILMRGKTKGWMTACVILCASASLGWGQGVVPPQEGRDPFEEARQRMRAMEERMNELLRQRLGPDAIPPEIFPREILPREIFPREDVPLLPRPFPIPRTLPAPRPENREEPRLGARLTLPTATLVEQLDLPRETGLVLEELAPNGAAAKAGLKAHDILLELAGRPVPRSPEAFAKELAAFKSDAPCEAVVMRKGVKQTIKGLQLPAAPAPERSERVERGGREEPNPLPRWELPELRIPVAGGGKANVFRFSRQGEQFAAEIQSGGVRYHLQGKRTATGPVLTGVQIEREGKVQTYDRLEAMPEADRAAVERLLRSIR
jgi:hypothetical protein